MKIQTSIEQAEQTLALIRRERARRMAALARESLIDACAALVPGFLKTKLHEHVCAQLERITEEVIAGHVARYLIEMPPQHGKTTMVQVWMLWHAARVRSHVAFATYSAEKADGVSMETRAMRELAREIWPNLEQPRSKKDTISEWATQESSFRFVGVGGSLTGFPASLLVVDDPFKDQQEAWSPTIRRNRIAWFGAVASTRLAKAHAVVVIQTRWHEADLIGHLKEQHKQGLGWPWEVISYPALAVEEDDFGRAPGDALCPELRDEAWLANQRQVIGELLFASLYQQAPSIEGGSIFRRPDFAHRYEHDPQRPPVRYARTILSVDANLEGKTGNDRTAITAWGEQVEHLDALDLVVNEPLDFPDLVRVTLDGVTKWQPDALLIENKANGPALIAMLKKQLADHCRRASIKVPAVVSFEPGARSKTARAQAASMHWRAGVCRLPESAPWLDVFITQHLTFGGGALHDDIVDSASQAVLFLRDAEKSESPIERARRMLLAAG